jgi:N-acetylmuramoyl-L-alanine amidase
MKKLTICIDPGHGMSNRKSGVYDCGACVKDRGKSITEASIVMDWANELRALLEANGHKVIRTRKDSLDPAPVGERAEIARRFGCDVFISLHCNAANGQAEGTETFYRGGKNKSLATSCNEAVCSALGTKDRGIKTEGASQHSRLAVLNFPRAVLIELGFIDHPSDRARMTDGQLMLLACQNLVTAIEEP